MTQVAQSYSRYFDKFLATLEKLGLTVSMYSQYESILGNSSAFREALTLVYSDIIIFLDRSRHIFRKHGQLSYSVFGNKVI